MTKAWKTPSLRPILIYFEFRSKPSLITVISMDPRPTNYLRQNIVFSYSEMTRVSFSLFLSLSVFCYVTLLLIFMKIILLLSLIFFSLKLFLFFHVPGYSGIFRDVPECSGMFRNVPCSGFYGRPEPIPYFRNSRGVGGRGGEAFFSAGETRTKTRVCSPQATGMETRNIRIKIG